jgi:4-amino-4-deoxy-L-arabinose transferase-like glycosyltransferase
MWMLLRKGRISALLYVSGLIALNLLFWFPNPSPPRHYLMMAPAMSVSAALVSEALAGRIARLRSYSGWIAGIAAAFCIVGISLALGHREGRRGYFPSQFEDRLIMMANIAGAKRAAEGLVPTHPQRIEKRMLAREPSVFTTFGKGETSSS